MTKQFAARRVGSAGTVPAGAALEAAMIPSGCRVGVDPLPRVYTIENNDEAYHIWRAAQVADRILVHIDAHPDLDWRDDDEPVSITSFISRGIAQGLVREVYWIIPDPTWQDARCRKALIRHMQEVLSHYPGRHPAPQVNGSEVTLQALKTRIRIRPLRAFPQLEEPVLLDLDTDFLLIPRLPDEEGRAPSTLPWCWPDALITCLKTHHLRVEIATVAYSVEGGLTPLRWKYLGDELTSRIRQPMEAQTDPVWPLHRHASIAQAAGRLEEAERALTRVLALDPHNASAYFRLAHLHAERGQAHQARTCYRQAVAEDSSYGTFYSNEALAHFAHGDLDRAEAECRCTLVCNPDDACAHYALGAIAAARRRWTVALEHLHHAIHLQSPFLDAHRALAAALEGARRLPEAIAAYERALRLGCSPAFTLSDKFITSRAPITHRVDRRHFEIYRRLARLYARQGRLQDAVTSYRIWLASVQGGRLLDRLPLVWMYGRQFRLREALATVRAAMAPNASRLMNERLG